MCSNANIPRSSPNFGLLYDLFMTVTFLITRIPPHHTVFRVFFTEEDFTYGEADQLTPVCVDAVGRIDRDDVTATISSVATGTATGERTNTTSI